MRYDITLRRFVISLSMVASLALLTDRPSYGWDTGFAHVTASQPTVTNQPRTAAHAAAAPNGARPAARPMVQQAYAQGAPATGAVQQTAHTGPSRNGSLFGGNPASTAKKGATWHGYQLRMPTKLFSRGDDSARANSPNPGPTDPESIKAAATLNAAIQRSRQGSAGQPAGHPTSGNRQAGGGFPTAASTASRQTPASAAMHAGRQPVAAAPATAMPAGRAMPNMTAAGQTPRNAGAHQPASPAAFSAPQSATPIQSPITAAATPAVEAKTAADRLILQANELAATAQREEDYTRIIETCRRARASQPTEQLNRFASELAAWSFNRRGQLKAESGRVKESTLDFDDAIRANPECWRALHNRGVLQAQAGRFEKAFDDFNRTIQINPEFAKAYSNRAALFVVAGDLPAALSDYAKAIELDANLAIAHRGRGRACHMLNRLDEAIDHYDAAVQLAPNDAYAVASRADLLTDLGRYVEAAEGYDRAIQLDPQSAGALRGSAWLLATCPESSVRDAARAIERAERVIELEQKDDAISYDTLAAAHAAAGDFPAAMHTVRRAIELAPAEERDVYQDRLMMYQRAKPFRMAPLRTVTQVNYEEISR